MIRYFDVSKMNFEKKNLDFLTFFSSKNEAQFPEPTYVPIDNASQRRNFVPKLAQKWETIFCLTNLTVPRCSTYQALSIGTYVVAGN